MNYHNITHDDMNNGDGLRVVLWLSGCSHHCNNCQNPQTWNPDSGIKFDEDTKKEIFEELSKDYINGITLSGGDPLYKKNISTILSLVVYIKREFPNKTIWIYSGFTLEEILKDKHKKEIIELCDVLIDGKYIEGLRNIELEFRGSTNQRVIDIKETIDNGEIKLWTKN